MHRITELAATAVLTLGTSAAVQGADLAIERFAPDTTFFVMGAPNMAQTLERWNRTGLADLWKSEELQNMIKEHFGTKMDEMSTQWKEMLDELELEKEDIVPPSGAAGMAVFFSLDDETGAQKPGMILFADYGEDADKFARVIDTMLTKGEDEGHISWEEDEVLGRTVRTLEFADETEDADADVDADDEWEDDEWGDDWEDEGGFDPEELFSNFSHMSYVRDGSVFWFSTSLGHLTEALEHIDADDSAGFSELSEFAGSKKQVGDGGDLYMVLLPKKILQMLPGEAQMMMAMGLPIMNQVVGDIQGIGVSARLDGDKAMLESTMGIYMPSGKSGITQLIDTPAPRGDLPAFLGEDVVGVNVIGFKFDQIVPFVRTFLRNNQWIAQQVGMGDVNEVISQMEAALNPILSPLGDHVVVTTTAREPIGPDTVTQLVAVKVDQAQQFEDAFSQLAAQADFESRDFLGQRIYTLPMSGMGMGGGGMAMGAPSQDVSVGVGSGFVLIGNNTAVEDAMRAGGAEAGQSVADNSKFKRAMGLITGDKVVAWGYSDPIESARAMMATQRGAMEAGIADMREFDTEAADEMEAEMKKQWDIIDDLNWGLFRRYIGPQSWEMRSTSDGFVLRSYQLSGAEE